MRWINIYLLIVLFVCLTMAFAISGTAIYLNPAKAYELIQANHAINIIDIRTEDEFKSAHLVNAQNIDYLKPDFEDQINKLNSGGEYIFYCRSGARTQQAMDNLERKQFTKLYILQGGIMSWQRFGNPIVK